MAPDNSVNLIFNSSELSNAEMVELRLRYYSIIVPILAVICLFGAVVNCYILLATRWLHRVPSPTLAFTISLCAADAWVMFQFAAGFILQSYVPYVLEMESLFSSPLCFGLALGKSMLKTLVKSMLKYPW